MSGPATERAWRVWWYRPGPKIVLLALARAADEGRRITLADLAQQCGLEPIEACDRVEFLHRLGELRDVLGQDWRPADAFGPEWEALA